MAENVPDSEEDNDTAINRAVGAAICGLRMRQEVTREALAAHLEVTPDLLHRMERGAPGLSPARLYRAARFLHVGVGDLFLNVGQPDVLTLFHAASAERERLLHHLHDYIALDARGRDAVRRLAVRLAR